MTPFHLNQTELSRRWRISPRTLERWRWLQQGPAYLKIGGRVVYRLEDVEAFETAQLRKNTTGAPIANMVGVVGADIAVDAVSPKKGGAR